MAGGTRSPPPACCRGVRGRDLCGMLSTLAASRMLPEDGWLILVTVVRHAESDCSTRVLTMVPTPVPVPMPYLSRESGLGSGPPFGPGSEGCAARGPGGWQAGRERLHACSISVPMLRSCLIR